ncbi:dynein regulatory complex protein 8 isoform X3 [Castor canadensis]|uniref:Dynein regulatory complex protein 8 isoform X3 n=1 Tax=Castor canadensis TaxID=51338 RepID=A0AC58KJ34_CASCN
MMKMQICKWCQAEAQAGAVWPSRTGAGSFLQCRLLEIGTIIRSLGCCPSEGELHDLIAEVEEEEPTGYIRFEKFLPVMTKVLLERRYRPIPEDVLLRAFEVLDTAKRGYLTREELVKLMTEEEGAVQSGRCLRLEAGTPQASGTGLHASGSPQDAKMVCILV